MTTINNNTTSVSSNENKMKSILKSTEELVTQARLNQITKEHRSIGAILDDRIMYDLDDPTMKRNKKIPSIEIEKKANLNRRGGIKGENEIKDHVELAINSYTESGISLDNLTGDYSLEQR